MLDKISWTIWISGIWLTSSTIVYGSYRFAQKRAKKNIEAKGYQFVKEEKLNLKGKLTLFTVALLPTTGYIIMKCVLNPTFDERVLTTGLKNKTIIKKN